MGPATISSTLSLEHMPLSSLDSSLHCMRMVWTPREGDNRLWEENLLTLPTRVLVRSAYYSIQIGPSMTGDLLTSSGSGASSWTTTSLCPPSLRWNAQAVTSLAAAKTSESINMTQPLDYGLETKETVCRFVAPFLPAPSRLSAPVSR